MTIDDGDEPITLSFKVNDVCTMVELLTTTCNVSLCCRNLQSQPKEAVFSMILKRSPMGNSTSTLVNLFS